MGLWLMMSALTLLHAGALIAALYDVATAKVRCPDQPPLLCRLDCWKFVHM